MGVICAFFTRLDPEFVLLPGDEITATCVYNTLSSKRYVYYGESTSDEMCYGFITFYPKEAITVKCKFCNQCIDFGDTFEFVCHESLAYSCLNSSFCVFRSQRPVVTRMLSKQPKVLAVFSVTCFIRVCAFRLDTTDFSKGTLVHIMDFSLNIIEPTRWNLI